MMPTYQFEDRDGNPVEMFLAMGAAPSFGEWGTFDGRRLKRVIERPVAPHIPDVTCVIRSQAKWDPTYPKTTPEGWGLIENRKDHEEYKARNPDLVWD